MLKNYLKIALRNLIKHKAYSFINIVGLAIGIGCCMLILVYVQDELRYDRFHAHAERIYRVVASTSEDGQPTNANGAFSWSEALHKDFPEIEQVARFHKMGWGEKRVVAHGENRFYEERFFFADSNVFKIFSFPFVAGNPARALTEPNTAVITARLAQKYFGHENPLGNVLALDPYNDGKFIDLKITGVLRDLPSYSHIQFDILASFASATGRTQGWGFDPVFTYALLAENASATALQDKFPDFLKKYMGQEPWYSLSLQPLRDIRLHSSLRAELEPNGDIAYVYLFSAIAFFVLLIACINFMNLATARSTQRAKEVGIRKVVGAQRQQLVRQFLGEAILLNLVALILAVVLVESLLPVFSALSGKAMAVRSLDTLPLLGGVIGLALLAGIFSGSYPAFFLSALQPVRVLKGGSSGSKNTARLRQGLVAFQFAISIVLIACTVIVHDQMNYMRAKNLGFQKSQILVLPLNEEVRRNYSALRAEWLREGIVQNVTMTEQVPAKAGNGSGYRLEGQAEIEGVHRFFVDAHFGATYGIEMAAGRDFSESIRTDAEEAFLVNEAFARSSGWQSSEQALGKSVTMYHMDLEKSGRIVGVTKDFHLFSFRENTTPLLLTIMPADYFNFISVRIVPAHLPSALAHLEKIWKAFAPSYPFDYYFLDQDFARLHRADEQLGQVFVYFAGLAIAVACLGLFGLAAFSAEQRTKEIGVRKVLGASVRQILLLFSRDFTKLILIAFVLAAPLAYFGMQRWLQAFVFRVTPGPGVFLLSGGLALLIAWLTVSFQALKAALANPVEALRYE
ncbi:MAG: ABC transporter permease [bacterium]